MKLEVGEYYMLRDGSGPYKILRDDDDANFPMDANNGSCYTRGGGSGDTTLL